MKILSVLFGLALMTLAPLAGAVDVGGVNFPDRLNGAAANMKLVGAAVMARNFVPFYAGALYVPPSVRSVAQLRSGLSPCRIQLVWMAPDLDLAPVQSYWRGVIEAAAGKERFPRVKAQGERLVQAMIAAKRGQRIDFDYDPDAGVRLRVDDKPLVQLAGVEFNRSLLDVWIGESAPAYFRQDLLHGLKP
jgi:hypothetical protein